MAEFEHRPLLKDYADSHQQVEDPTQLDVEKLATDIKGTMTAEGRDLVNDALGQLATGHVNSQELMAWIDDLRDPDLKDPAPVIPDGFLHDFEADSEFAGGSLEDPSGKDDGAPPPPVATDNTDTSGGNDDDYFFSATRKRNLGEDGEDDGDGEAPKDGEVKPAAVKAPKTKTTKKS